ncbi:hypothetical protein H4J59_16020 [Colwellia sp. MB02u-10]|uniref:hypothetical protein n=1 Tax=Colwellia sp. MB02u-10 TaxID=2759828 RepID=UPI0015F54690|nr:hypothetical protein [Colwellia sp. MB02u-10]MBA6342500.1 hypothetical protein [Colwellia sp. MB02u-10]
MSGAMRKMFRMLAKHAATIDTIITEGVLPPTEEALKGFDELHNYNLAFETASGSIRLSSAFQNFLENALKTERTLAINLDVGGYWRSILFNINQLNHSNTLGAYSDSDMYKRLVIDSIYQLLDGINNNIQQLRNRIENQFGYVHSISAKRKENEQAIAEARTLRQALNIIDEAELLERPITDLRLRSIINNDLFGGKQSAIKELINALTLMQALLIGFRKLEGRGKLVRQFKQYFDTKTDHDFSDLISVEDISMPPNITNLVKAMNIDVYPDESSLLTRNDLIDLAQSLNLEEGERFKKERDNNSSLDMTQDNVEKAVETPIGAKWLEDILLALIETPGDKVLVNNIYQQLQPECKPQLFLDAIYTEILRLPAEKSKFFIFKPLGNYSKSFNGNFDIKDISICFNH